MTSISVMGRIGFFSALMCPQKERKDQHVAGAQPCKAEACPSGHVVVEELVRSLGQETIVCARLQNSGVVEFGPKIDPTCTETGRTVQIPPAT